jgi:hypothetical protein
MGATGNYKSLNQNNDGGNGQSIREKFRVVFHGK